MREVRYKGKNGIKSPAIFYIYYFIVFFGIAIQGSFLNLYLTEAGLPVKTVGIINGVIQLLSLVVMPVLGRIADRAATKNMVLLADFAGSGLHHLFEKAGLQPIKGLYLTLIPLNVIGILLGTASIRRGGTGERTAGGTRTD